MGTPRQQTVADAYRIIDDFPGTCGADYAQKFLAALGSPVRTTPPQRYWLAHRPQLVAAAAAVPVLLVVYALYRWRLRAARAARGACRRCGYDLSQGNPASGRCPECGSPAPAPSSSGAAAPITPPPADAAPG